MLFWYRSTILQRQLRTSTSNLPMQSKRSPSRSPSELPKKKRLRSVCVVPAPLSFKPSSRKRREGKLRKDAPATVPASSPTQEPAQATPVANPSSQQDLNSITPELVTSLLGSTMLTQPPLYMAPEMQVVRLRDNFSDIWRDPRVNRHLKRLDCIRRAFVHDLLKYTNTGSDLPEMCGQMKSALGNWLEELRQRVKGCQVGTRKQRNVALLTLKHRVAGLSYAARLAELSENATRDVLRRVSDSMSMFFYVVNIARY